MSLTTPAAGRNLTGHYGDDVVVEFNPAATGVVFGSRNIISTVADGADSVFAADVDSDGDMDVLSASREDDKIAWYENDGIQNFMPHTISVAADGVRRIFVADVDGDLDVLSASRFDDTIAWYENLGDGTPVSRQIVTPTPVAQTAIIGDSFTFDVIYTTDPLDETLTGLGLRLHFDSTQVQFDGLSNVLQTSLFLAESVSINTEDFDADPATDMFVSVA